MKLLETLSRALGTKRTLSYNVMGTQEEALLDPQGLVTSDMNVVLSPACVLRSQIEVHT